MHVKLLFPGLSGEVRTGDEIITGMTISNSEVGEGTLRLDWFDGRVVCLNGAVVVVDGGGFKRNHGASVSSLEAHRWS